MIKQLILFGICILGNGFLFSQEIKLVSEKDASLVTDAQIEISCVGDKTILNLVSNSEGAFNVPSELKCGTYLLIIKHEKFEEYIYSGKISSALYIKLSPIGGKLKEVVVTGQYSGTTTENAVHKIKVIDKATIDKMGAQNLRDVLTNALNIRLSQDNVLGSSMNIQGVSGQNVKILIDGVAVIGRLDGNVDISQINMNNVERIEIVEGPLSVNFGTDALAGTINIITKKFTKPSTNLSASGYYESIGQYNYSARLSHSTKKYTFSLIGGRNYFDGWKYNDKPFHFETEKLADTTRVMSWKPKEQFFGTAFIGRHFKRMKLGFTSDYFYEQMMNRGMPREPYFESAFDDYYTTQRFSNSVVLNGKVCENVNANFIFANNYFKRIKNTYINDLTTLDQTLTESAADQDTTVFNTATLRGTLSTARENKKVNAEIGYDLNHEVGKGLRIKGNMQQIGDYAVFLSAEFKPFATTVIRPGVRASYNTSYSAPVIPSLNIKQTFGKKNTIRVSYARGFRAPSLKDLYFYFVDVNHNIKGNENLKAEYSHNFSLNYTKSFEFKSVGLKIDNGYFYNSIDNLISLAQYSGTEYSYFNLNKYKTVGAQLQLDVKFEKLLVAIGGTYIGRYNQLSDSMDVDPFFFSPEGRLNLQYSFTDNFVVSLFYKYTGETPNVSLDANNQLYSSKIDDYHMLDCSVMRSFLEKKITITVGAKNLMNVRNILGSATSGAHSGSSSTIPMATGRLYFLKADINLELKKNKK